MISVRLAVAGQRTVLVVCWCKSLIIKTLEQEFVMYRGTVSCSSISITVLVFTRNSLF